MTYSSTGSSEENHDTDNIDASLASPTTIEEAAPLITTLLVAKLASLLSSPADKFDVRKPLHAYGVDSLVAVEIRNWFAKQVKVDIAVFDLLGGATMRGWGGWLRGRGRRSWMSGIDNDMEHLQCIAWNLGLATQQIVSIAI
ncbi:hypothetical protein BDV19DRAFT_386815 [Aspergillus venezuelensis]